MQKPTAVTERELRLRYHVEQVQQLTRQAANALISTLLVLVFVVYAIKDIVNTQHLILWTAAILASNLYLLLWLSLARREGITAANVRRFFYSYQLQALLHGLAWGMLPFMLLQVTTPELQLLVYYVICGLAAGAIATIGMNYLLYLSFMLPMMSPVVLYQWLGQDIVVFDPGSMGLLVIFLISMLVLAYAHYESTMRGIRLLFDNDALLTDLQAAYNRAETASRAKTEFLSNMSHELRTPLNAIMGFSSLLIKFAKHHQPEKIREFAQNINEAGKHLSALINQVLDLTRIESGNVRVDIQPLSLKPMLLECIQLLQPMAEDCQVRLISSVDETGAQQYAVLADPLRLRQVLINLLSNAIKYNVSGGSVTLRCIYHQDSVLVEVADNGLGIPEQEQASIFNPFTRAHLDANVEGSGIGLAVTRKNLQLMHSDIAFQSRLGEGSRFWFVLDTCSMQASPSSLEPPQADDFDAPLCSNIRVLYVEDNPLGMRLMEEVLGSQENIQLFKATTGKEGYALALQERPDIVILDINLPDMNGMEILQRLLQVEGMAQTPMVALSASALEEDVEKGLQAGFCRYLRKPCEPDDVLAMVYELAVQYRGCAVIA